MSRVDDFLSLYKANVALFDQRAYSEVASLLFRKEQIKVKD